MLSWIYLYTFRALFLEFRVKFPVFEIISTTISSLTDVKFYRGLFSSAEKEKKEKRKKKEGKRAFKMLGKYATYTCTVHSTWCRYRVVKGEKAKNLLSHRQRYHSTIHDFLTSISALCPPLLRRAIFLHQRFLRILTNITPGMRLKTRAL